MKKNLLARIGLSAFAAASMMIAGCSKDSNNNTVATVGTNAITAEVTATSAISGGVLSDIGSASVTTEGVCYSTTNQSPTISDSHTSSSTITGSFISTLSSLTAGTTYYVRAYATSSAGTGYGPTVKFTTAAANATPATVSTFAGSGSEGFTNGVGTAAQFWNPQAIASDAQGNLYVADLFNHVIRKITTAGIVTTFCGSGVMGHQDGAANVAQFYAPAALTVDAQGNVYVADQGTNLIIKITPAGVATTIAGNGSANYINSTNALSAAFNAPRGIAVDAQGNIYVGDTGNNLIRKITPAGVVTTFAGGNTTSASTITLIDATGTDARFRQPRGLAFDSKGNLLVADYGNNSIRKIASDGTVSTYIGNSTISTLVGNPTALVLDGSDNVYIADEAGRVLKINSSLSVMNTIAGTSGSNGYQEGAGNTAQFNVPAGVAVVSGNVYVADYANSRIRKITGIQ